MKAEDDPGCTLEPKAPREEEDMSFLAVERDLEEGRGCCVPDEGAEATRCLYYFVTTSDSALPWKPSDEYRSHFLTGAATLRWTDEGIR